MEALGDVLRPSMLGPSSSSGEENIKNHLNQTKYGQFLLYQSFDCGKLMLSSVSNSLEQLYMMIASFQVHTGTLQAKLFLSKTLK